MLTRSCLRWTALLAALLLTACGNQQKAEFYLLSDSVIDHPDLVRGIARIDLASILATMDLSPELANELRAWSQTEGASIRREVDTKLAAAEADLPKLVTAAESLLTARAASAAAQDGLLTRQLGDDAKRVLDPDPPVDVGELTEARARPLEAVVDKLTLRQRLVALGGWSEAGEKVAAWRDATEDDAEAARVAVIDQVLQALGYAFLPDDEAKAKVEQALGQLTGNRKRVDVEAALTSLFSAKAPAQPEELRQQTAQTLATLLAMESAGELLALVK